MRELTDRRLRPGRQSFNREQRLMLLRLQVMVSGLHFAEVQELPKLKSKVGQVAIVLRCEAHRFTIYRITHYICFSTSTRSTPAARRFAHTGYAKSGKIERFAAMGGFQ